MEGDASTFESPAQVSAAAAADRDPPGEAGEPGVLGRRRADGDGARRFAEAAEVVVDAGGIGAPVTVTPLDRDPVLLGGHRLGADGAEQAPGG